MDKKTTFIAAGWALSCGAAFFIGRTNSDAPSNSTPANNSTLVSSSGPSRTISRDTTTSSKSSNRSGRKLTGSGTPDELQLSVDDLLAITDPISRTQGFLELVENLSPDQFLSVVDYYRSFGVDDQQFGEYGILLTAWAKVDPLQALTYASEKTRGSFARQTILASWAKDDPESAISWAKGNFEEGKDTRDPANPWLVGVIKGIASQDMPRATQLLEELPYSRGRSEALDSIFDSLNREGTEATKEWISRLSDEQLQAGAASRLADKMAESNPKEAIEWAVSVSKEALKNSADDIVEKWAASDLKEAQAWVDSQPTEIASSAAPELIDAIIDQSGVVAASAWLSQHEGDPAFDRTVQTLVWNSMRETPELGFDWIMKMTNERERARTAHRTIGDWARRDMEGAYDYVQNNPVPEGIQKRLEYQLKESQKSK